MTQKYQKGDLVQVNKKLPSTMSHFTANVQAIVVGSYNDKFGGGNTSDYTLYIEGQGETAWYHDTNFTLIEKDRLDLLAVWKKTAEELRVKQVNLDWIFDNGPELVRDGIPGPSFSTLGLNLGITNLWGTNGEGITYFNNCNAIRAVVKPFMLTKDKEGWLKLAESFVKRTTVTA